MALYIYHSGTGTVLPLSDSVYLVNDKYCDEETLEAMSNGGTVPNYAHKGLRIDNHNMGNLFYGGE
jgi:hypothetical protein